MVRPDISDLIIGNLKYENRVGSIIELAKDENKPGYFKFSNKYTYLNSDSCYWVKNEYNSSSGFAVVTDNTNEITKLYSEQKNTNCKVIPVIIAEKVNLN